MAQSWIKMAPTNPPSKMAPKSHLEMIFDIEEAECHKEGVPVESHRIVWLREQLIPLLVKPMLDHGRFPFTVGDGRMHHLPALKYDFGSGEPLKIPTEKLLNRLEYLIRYQLPWGPEQGVPGSIRQALAPGAEKLYLPKALRLWENITELAFAGALRHVRWNDMDDLLYVIRGAFYWGEHHKDVWCPMEQGAPKKVVPAPAGPQIRKAPPERAFVKQAAPKETVLVRAGGKRKAAGEKASPIRKLTLLPPRVNKEADVRRATASRMAAPPPQAECGVLPSGDGEDDDFEGDTRAKQPRNAGKAGKKARPGKSADDKGPGQLFGENLKWALSHRNAAKDAFGAFQDAILPTSEPLAKVDPEQDRKVFAGADRDKVPVGDTTGLHEYEVDLCKLTELSADEYKCQKARIFLGLAMFLGYIEHRSGMETRLQQFGKTQVQQCVNVNVNHASRLFVGFVTFGWLDAKWEKEVPADMRARYPRAHRENLLREMRAWEVIQEDRKTKELDNAKLQKFGPSVLKDFQLDPA
ncbi:hypothetical protein H2200_000907 [Cladophialophora chaetospira]|uniref:Uncharacterized protein n=1 Tax=Cladophialophora chaetospira TaxID=386627 RepID=A0AA39CRG3_9EURO|nr:hypothetical protein H2200_000907 [Cladophialophora chaetospira]